MKDIVTKKEKRKENKKKKMLAEIELYKLNDKKREAKELGNTSKQGRKLANQLDDPDKGCRSEPKSKRQKKEDEQFIDKNVDCQIPAPNQSNTSNYTIQPSCTTLVSGDELVKLRQALRERKKVLKAIPKLQLRNAGVDADLSQATKKTPLFLSDIQHLLMYSQLGQHSPYDPRWAVLEKCSAISRTIVLVVEGASVYDYINNESGCKNLSKMVARVEVVSPFSYGGSIVEEICAVPLSKTQKAKLERKFGNLSSASQSNDKVFKVLRSMFPIKHVSVKTPNDNHSKNNKQKAGFPATDKFSRTDLLLSAWQLVEEGYPLPLRGELSTRYANYILTKDQYVEVTSHSPMWALDCEMCQTSHGNELTRISIVNEDLQVMYENLVKPHNEIINYLTRFSGITRAMLKNVTKRLEDVQEDLRNLLPPDIILVGQSLNMDLHALKMMHPYIIDTSVVFNLSGERHRKSKLSVLTTTFLNETIQKNSKGHDSVEDSSASLKLVQLKLSKSIEFGDAVLSERYAHSANITKGVKKLQKEETKESQSNNNNEFNLATSLFSHVTSQNKTVSLISSNQILSEYSPFITAATFGVEDFTKVECQIASTNDKAIEKTLEEISKHMFCLTHLQLAENESIGNVDQWTSQLLKCGVDNSLVIVILAGSPETKAHGAAFLHITKAASPWVSSLQNASVDS